MSTPKPWADTPFKLIHTPNFDKETASTHDFEYSECSTAASWMAVLHNGLIRGLNTIYLQAPHVQPADYAAFTAYCLLWAETVNSHHHGEETNLFPAIEAAAIGSGGPDAPGLMAENLKQHGMLSPPFTSPQAKSNNANTTTPPQEVFHHNLSLFTRYLGFILRKPSSFRRQSVINMIDSFSDALLQHFAAEVASLVALEGHEPPVPVLAFWRGGIGNGDGTQREGKKGREGMATIMMGKWAKMQHYLFFMYNHDKTFEAPLWEAFPEMSPYVRYAMVYGASWWNWRLWKFASCDCWGRPKGLYAVGS